MLRLNSIYVIVLLLSDTRNGVPVGIQRCHVRLGCLWYHNRHCVLKICSSTAYSWHKAPLIAHFTHLPEAPASLSSPPPVAFSLRACVRACLCARIRMPLWLSICLSVYRSTLSLFPSLFIFFPQPVFPSPSALAHATGVALSKPLVIQKPSFYSC